MFLPLGIMIKSWHHDKAAGLDWLRLFMGRNKLSERKPEATSLGRASAFYRHNLDLFYYNLLQLLQMRKYEGHQIYNADETGVSTVQNPRSVIARRGNRKVGQMTSDARGALVTVLCCVNATGNSIPPMLIFPRKRYNLQFLRGAPSDSLGAVSLSGWINDMLWLDFLKHFAKHTRGEILCSSHEPESSHSQAVRTRKFVKNFSGFANANVRTNVRGWYSMLRSYSKISYLRKVNITT